MHTDLVPYKLEAGGDGFRCRVTGDDPAEVVRAAQIAGAAVLVTGRGRYWFHAVPEQLVRIRAELPLSSGDFCAWRWLLKPKGEYFIEGYDRASDDIPALGGGSRSAEGGEQDGNA